MKEELRQRFRSEYLGQLVQRTKPINNVNFEIGDLVFVVDNHKKRLKWNLAKIVELFPGKDNQSRVARIKTANGELTRSFQRLVPLEVKETETEFYFNPEAVKKAKELRKKKPEVIKFKKATIVNDEKEVITKSGRKVKKTSSFSF